MFEKLLSVIGVGGATIETKINNQYFEAGKMVKGEIIIKGGKVEQIISKIHIELNTNYHRDEPSSELNELDITLNEKDILYNFEIKPGDLRTFPFELMVPYGTPISFGQQRIKLITGINVEKAPDPKSKEEIKIGNRLIERTLNILKGGFVFCESSGKCWSKTDDDKEVLYQSFKIKNDEKKIKEFYFNSSEDGTILVDGKKELIITEDMKKEAVIEFITRR